MIYNGCIDKMTPEQLLARHDGTKLCWKVFVWYQAQAVLWGCLSAGAAMWNIKPADCSTPVPQPALLPWSGYKSLLLTHAHGHRKALLRTRWLYKGSSEGGSGWMQRALSLFLCLQKVHSAEISSTLLISPSFGRAANKYLVAVCGSKKKILLAHCASLFFPLICTGQR